MDVSPRATQALAQVGLRLPRILFPNRGTDLTRFAVVACDQYTSDLEYWDQVEELVGDAPSALRLMLPEAFLPDEGGVRQAGIQAAMRQYLDDGLFTELAEGFIFLHRRTQSGSRRGLVAAVDLDAYDFTPGATSLIRATEGTVLERLPPRVAIRREAPIEMPHIMMLIDDDANLLMSALDRRVAERAPLYDFELMQNGGHLIGWTIGGEEDLLAVAGALKSLLEKAGDNFLFAMGDGNHSLAAGKAFWESIKPGLSEAERVEHPARYALVEIVNLYDAALNFEPIHRVLFGLNKAELLAKTGIDADAPPPLQELQPLLDRLLAEEPSLRIDYVHGEQETLSIAAAAPDRVALIMPPFPKDGLFETVRRDGVFVRKSFSMGEANEKRYYLECRKLRAEQ